VKGPTIVRRKNVEGVVGKKTDALRTHVLKAKSLERTRYL
jgi:hypothetical protein